MCLEGLQVKLLANERDQILLAAKNNHLRSSWTDSPKLDREQQQVIFSPSLQLSSLESVPKITSGSCFWLTGEEPFAVLWCYCVNPHDILII